MKKLGNNARFLFFGNDKTLKGSIIRLGKKILHVCGIKAIRFERRIKNKGIRLRPYRLSDLSVLHALFDEGIFITAGGVENKIFNSSFSLWRWMISTFQMMYVVEAEIDGNHQIIGFIGLYNMLIGKSLWLSAAVFNPQDRRQGYGQAALGLLLDSLQKRGLVQMVYGEVFKTNAASFGLCRKLGFEMCGRNKNSFFMERSVKDHHTGLHCVDHKMQRSIDLKAAIGLHW